MRQMEYPAKLKRLAVDGHDWEVCPQRGKGRNHLHGYIDGGAVAVEEIELVRTSDGAVWAVGRSCGEQGVLYFNMAKAYSWEPLEE